MDETKKISYKSLKEKLSDEKLKRIIAGSGGGGDPGCWKCVCANFYTFYRAYKKECFTTCDDIGYTTIVADRC